METPLSLKNDYELTEEAFECLLAGLATDRQQAAEHYEEIRRKLITYFEFRDCRSPHDLTDITINRVAYRLREGETIIAKDISSYFYGVARNVLREYWKDEARAAKSLNGHLSTVEDAYLPEEMQAQESEQVTQEKRLQCMEVCLQEITPEARQIIVTYYRDEHGKQIPTRQRLAEELGIPAYALRVRISRQRAKLEDCIRRCMSR